MSQTVTTVSNLHYGCPGTAIQVYNYTLVYATYTFLVWGLYIDARYEFHSCLQLRILRMRTPQVRTQETWFLAVDRNVSYTIILFFLILSQVYTNLFIIFL